MNKKLFSGELLDYLEKSYDLESEVKSRLDTKVQLIFTAIVALATIASYMLRMLDLEAFPELTGVIVLLMVGFFILLLIAAYLAVRAFWGNEFKKMPKAGNVETYYRELLSYNDDLRSYKAYDESFNSEEIDVDAEVENMIGDYYRECADHNFDVNANRNLRIHTSIKFILFSMLPFLFAGMLFVAFDLDASSPRKDLLISDHQVAEQLKNIHIVLSRITEE